MLRPVLFEKSLTVFMSFYCVVTNHKSVSLLDISAHVTGNDRNITIFVPSWCCKRQTEGSACVWWFLLVLIFILCIRWVCGGACAPLPSWPSGSSRPTGTGAQLAPPWSGDGPWKAGPHLGPDVCLGHLHRHDGETSGDCLNFCMICVWYSISW